MNLLALLTAPLAFTLMGLSEDEAPQSVDPVRLLNALQRNADRIHLFCQIGRIQVPASHHPLYTFLESSVIQVKAKMQNCVFHPEVWVLRYVARGGEHQAVRYRVLCLSRNLTFDRSWDTALVLCGELRRDRPRQARMAPLSGFVS